MQPLIINAKEQALLFTALSDMQLESSCNKDKYITKDYIFTTSEIIDLTRKIQSL